MQITAYFAKGQIPILSNPGEILSEVSFDINKLKKKGRVKAKSTVAIAFIPGVLEKTSTNNPRKKPHNINPFLDIEVLSLRIKYMYKKGVAYPAI